MRLSFLFSSAVAAIALSACDVSVTIDDQASTDGSTLDVEVHDGEFATIQQFTTPGGVSVWLVEEPSIPILSLPHGLAWR